LIDNEPGPERPGFFHDGAKTGVKLMSWVRDFHFVGATMGRLQTRATIVSIAFGLIIFPALADRAFAQADKPPAPADAPAPAATPGSSPQAAPVPGAPVSAPAKKSGLSAPACSVRFLEAKVAGKLQGRTYADFRRSECGEKETTAVFPTAISPKYANEKDLDKARKLTCSDQFTANKATNANGGLKWIEKDGGYYGECVSRLKG
jgi:hypothetical protein